MTSWEHFPHEADIGVRGRGSSPSAAFEQAALALTAIITNLNLVRKTKILNFRRKKEAFNSLIPMMLKNFTNY